MIEEVEGCQSYVKKSTWDKIILKHHLYPLFQCHVLLDMFPNVENKLVMAGTNSEDIYVLIKGDTILLLILILFPS